MKRSLQQELLALVVGCCGVFLACALFSYHPDDSSWFFSASIDAPVLNWCGIVGAYLAALCIYVCGALAYALCLLCFFGAYVLFVDAWESEWDRVYAGVGLFLVCASLMHLYGAQGGVLGYMTSSLLLAFLDTVGTYLVLHVVGLACAILAFRVSFASYISSYVLGKKGMRLLARVTRPFSYVYAQVRELFAARAVHEHESVFLFEAAHDTPLESVPEFTTAVQQVVAQEQPQEPVYTLPDHTLFEHKESKQDKRAHEEYKDRAAVLEEKLERFGITGKIVSIKPGPVVTLFEYAPAMDIKLSKIVALEDDLALALQATSIRILAPIPGTSVVGFEVANVHRQSVSFGSLCALKEFRQSTAVLPLVVGEDTTGAGVIVDLARMPHLLVAGSTGSGKSVALNTMIISLLCSRTPDELQLILIDPKRLEFAPYADIPHLLFPIITDPRSALSALSWAVNTMQERYEKMAAVGVRSLADYQALALQDKSYKPFPYVVIIIDELADLMMTAGKECEESIARLAQMARAAGIHMIVATQRPSVDVVTGLIKVNFPSRMSFRVSSKMDSRTVLDGVGAEKLLGRGDMLFLDAQQSSLRRLHGAYVTDKDINAVVSYIKAQRAPVYAQLEIPSRQTGDFEEDEPLLQDVLTFLNEVDEISISLLQRRFRIGYNRSARIIDALTAQGRILASDGGKMRKVIRL